MKKRIVRYFKHITSTLIVLLVIAVLFGLYIGASLHYGDHPLMYSLDNEGPYVFYENDSLVSVNYVKGNKEDGFYIDKTSHLIQSEYSVSCFVPIDSSLFNFTIKADFKTPKTTYNDEHPIIAISDIEGGYLAFRDFLIYNKVIDEDLNWIFGSGHLVLLGDFVDRGNSVTQVLWFIYKLEQEAEKHGGLVHFIIGNHELKNMQGNFDSSEDKYLAIAGILGKRQSDLYNSSSLLGKWLSSKNAIELINGNLFVHGGIHPDITDTNLSLDEINNLIRRNYYKAYYPKREKTQEQLLTSTKTGLCWYRGYFIGGITQAEVDQSLDVFNAKSVIVGHTLQSKVNKSYEGKVIAIDVHHSKDYQKHWPNKQSEGLLIKEDIYYRVFANSDKEEL